MSLLLECIGPTSVVCARLITNGSGSGEPDLQRGYSLPAKRMAKETCEGPRPTVKGTVFYRSAGALGCQTRIREGFPRDRSMARDRPSPYVKGRRFFHRSAGAVTATLSDL